MTVSVSYGGAMATKKLDNVVTMRFATAELDALDDERALSRPILGRAELVRVLVAEALAARKAARKGKR